MDHALQTRPRPRPRASEAQEAAAATWKPVMQSSTYATLDYIHRERRPSFDEALDRGINRIIHEREQQEQDRRQAPIVISDDDEDDLPPRSAKRRRVGNRNDVAGRLRAEGARIANGIATPVTSDAGLLSESSSGRSFRARQAALTTHQEQVATSGEAVDSDDSEAQLPSSRRKKSYRVLSHEEATQLEARALSVLAVGPAFPQSAYSLQGMPSASSEKSALEDLYSDLQAASDEESGLPSVSLNNFAIYRPESSSRPLDLVTLNRLRADGSPEFCFDGVLSFGDKHHRVQGVPFSTLSVDGYGEFGSADMAGHIYLQSRLSHRNDIWYQLKSPASEYHRFHKEFVWLASFTRHFAGYLMSHQNVTLMHFQDRFAEWLSQKYNNDDAYHAWLQECGLRDFRDTVAMNIRYLREECWNIDDDEAGLLKQPIWGEVDPIRLTAIPQQPNRVHRTVVTPYAMECFQNMYFADQLDVHEVTDRTTVTRIDKRKAELKLAPRLNSRGFVPVAASAPLSAPSTGTADVCSGDIVHVQAEEGSLWGAGPWYAYVQNVRSTGGGDKVLDVLWLYTPKNTTMAKVYYPFPNELFLSDHCECGKDAIPLSDVLGKVQVSWFPKNPWKIDGFFIRQKFRTIEGSDSYDFVSLKSSDYICQCGHSTSDFDHCVREYAVGDTVLVRERHRNSADDHLEPAQIVRFDHEKQQIQVRRLARKSATCPRARLNELSLTSDLLYRGPTKIIRKCHVRYFCSRTIQQGNVPVPYDRDGTGDFFYVNSDDSCAQDNLPPLPQGLDPQEHKKEAKLIGMGIFCGGGTFDRGLEEGGAVKFRYAVDWATHALHSYRANADPEGVKYFLGSVNDLLARAMSGDYGDSIAKIVQVISAGSPCPGFSKMQQDKYSEMSKMNASMVASVVSYVDFYSPEYLILENVITMTAPMGVNKDQHVFAQIIAALVGLGYQVSQHLIESWSYGSPQRRPRLFIIATAPGLEPLKSPPHSHGHPGDLPARARSLGTAANGKKFACRRDDYTPFECNTAARSTEDLPNIADAQVGLCARFPDHVTACTRGNHSSETRTRIAMIPKRPHGMTMFQAAEMGVLRGEPLQFFKTASTLRKSKNSKSFSRVFPNGLFPTVLTAFSIGCAMEGRVLHWEQDRELTVREARRAQGYLDHEVLIGDARQRLKIIGNSVDRRSALVLGLALRESWFGYSRSDSQPGTPEPTNDVRVLGETVTASGSRSLVIDLDPDTVSDDDVEDGVDMLGRTEAAPRTPERVPTDNRAVKMALNLTPEDISEIRTGGFKHIKNLLDRSTRF